MVSDHYHPSTKDQGNSPFLWAVIGAIAQATDRITIGTGVTCPSIRIHPAVVAQAAATAALLLPGRFILDLGTGENLNEHITGVKWPAGGVRLEMLNEAIDIISELWMGRLYTHRGKYFTVENGQLFSLPEKPPPIIVAAAKKGAAALAGRRASGLISTAPNKSIVDDFRANKGEGKPRSANLVLHELSSASALQLLLVDQPTHVFYGLILAAEVIRRIQTDENQSGCASPCAEQRLGSKNNRGMIIAPM